MLKNYIVLIIVSIAYISSFIFSQSVIASDYRLEVIAKTGDAGLLTMGNNPSINDNDTVAFVGVLPSRAEGVFIGNSPNSPIHITPGFVSATRTFGRAVQINNSGKVIARDQVSGSPPMNRIRIWDSAMVNSFVIIARGGDVNAPYDSVFSHPSINSNAAELEDVAAPGGDDDGVCDTGELCIDQVVFSALSGSFSLLATPIQTPIDLVDHGTFNEIYLDIPLRPMIADNGRIIVRAGNLPTDPIVLYRNDLSERITIADNAMGFTALGQSPGISDDGRFVVFYGELSASGAIALGTTPGPGIFARADRICIAPGPDGILNSVPPTSSDDIRTDMGILSGPNGICETNNNGDDRLLVPVGSQSLSDIQRVAGLENGNLDPGETFDDVNLNGIFDAGDNDQGLFSAFSPDSRVSVNSVGTIVYMASDTSANLGIYTSRFDFIYDPLRLASFSVSSTPSLVTQVGDTIDGIGIVRNLSIHDPLNNKNRGTIVFWALTDTGNQAIVRAIPLCQSNNSNYSALLRNRNPYIHQYAAGRELNIPFSSTGVRGGNACGPSSLTMLLNTFKFTSTRSQRFDLYSASTDAIYRNTMTQPPADFVNNLFDWADALNLVTTQYAYLDSTLFEQNRLSLPPTVRDLKAFIDDKLSLGIPVLVSTTFSSGLRVPVAWGGGHVVMFVGRTLVGDYIVKDPAGNYFAGRDNLNEHYGLDAGGNIRSCGDNVIYPKDEVKLRLARRRADGTLIRYINTDLAEGTTTDIDVAAPRAALAIPASLDADPDGFLVTGNFSGEGARPYQLWVQDSSGRRTGWLANGDKVVEIPNSVADINPRFPSDPDVPNEDTADAQNWPFFVSINEAERGLRVFIYGKEDSDYSVRVKSFKDGLWDVGTISGSIKADEMKEIIVPSLITVPDVVGWIRADAETALIALKLLVSITEVSSSTVPAGRVISQSPESGSSVKTGTVVNLTVSIGLLFGDLNDDNIVDCADLGIVKASFGKKIGQTGFDIRADVNKDGIVNIRDLSLVSQKLAAGTKCI